jgi:hypothetical protein
MPVIRNKEQPGFRKKTKEFIGCAPTHLNLITTMRTPESKKARLPPGPQALLEDRLHVVVEREFIRMRPQANCVHFLSALVIDVGAQQLFREDIAFE